MTAPGDPNESTAGADALGDDVKVAEGGEEKDGGEKSGLDDEKAALGDKKARVGGVAAKGLEDSFFSFFSCNSFKSSSGT